MLAEHSCKVLAAFVLAVVVSCGGGGPARCRADDNAVAELAKKLKSKDQATRKEAIERLQQDAKLANELAVDLIKRFRDPAPDLRVAAAKAVAKSGKESRDWLPHFIRLFHDTDQTSDERPVWYDVAVIVGQEMGEDVLDELIPLLDEKNAAECRGACVAIYEIGPAAKPAVPALIKVLESRSTDVNLEVLYALRGIGPEAVDAIPALVRALDAKNMHTQYWSVQALGAMGEAAVPAVPDLIRKMATGLASVRRFSALALGDIGPKIGKAGIEALIGGLDDFTFAVRENSLQALAKLGPAAAAAGPVLKRKLVEKRQEPVGLALRTYWRITGDLEFVQPRFLARFATENKMIEAIPQLGKMGKSAEFAIPSLVEATRSHDEVVRLLAVEALGQIGVWNDAVRAAIRERLEKETDADVKDAAVKVGQSFQADGRR